MLVAASMSLSAQEHLKSLNPSYIDPATPASKDFYQHVNKGWMEAHPLTAEHARYGQFNILNDSSEYRVRDIVTNLAATNPKPGTVAYKVSTIYNQALDSTAATLRAPSLSSPTLRKSRTLRTKACRTR